jgi:hypothetical protein
MKICQEHPNVSKIGQQYRALYIKNYIRSIVAGDIKSLQKRSLRVTWYLAVRRAEEV